jgi:hypothetical protein
MASKIRAWTASAKSGLVSFGIWSTQLSPAKQTQSPTSKELGIVSEAKSTVVLDTLLTDFSKANEAHCPLPLMKSTSTFAKKLEGMEDEVIEVEDFADT